MKDKQEIGIEQHEQILLFLHRFGWLTSRMVKKLVYENSTQGIALARRALSKMVEKKLVLKRPLPNGAEAYLLGTKGASFLNGLKPGINSQSGARLKLGNTVHRACSNWYLIEEYVNNGRAISTEFEIQTGNSPVHQILGKVPDGLTYSELGADWIEVENTWKNRSERDRIVKFCIEMLGFEMSQLLNSTTYLHKVVLVCATKDSANSIVNSFIEAFENSFISVQALSEVEIAFAEMTPSLMPPKIIMKANLWYDLISPYDDPNGNYLLNEDLS